MALRFLIKTITPVERMTASLGFSRSCAGVKTAPPGTSGALPERPKKPASGYVQFVTDTIPRLRQQMPDAKSSEMMTKASALWKDLDMATKKRYNDAYSANKEKWLADMARFEASLSAQTRDQLMMAERKARDERRESRERRQRKRQMNERQKPRKPANAFMLYIQDRQATRGDRSQKDFIVDMAKEWANKPESERAPYVKRYTEAKEQYQKALVAWEGQMIKEGRADLVRAGSQPVIDTDEVPKSRR
ncbi:transcription factor A, mitochondrial-like isoform X3 [Amphibalanus amphitrite]|nr:transcription factor A, mitochondrial-like isoform X3 [Amphibalanus amphitrite]XP_043244776.1 transcription factor A, mitochondrial-like isoform X3 [Amphibalanus amphitrite]XP_043244777.1 transcription factor A, mitochondrial-like isoform X3 [Amphibalanus amphitrite]XP_043244778.1 transcription factor A, mitochondrial-like isoform X3 [Amphibalanus amphitrite]